MSTFHKEISLPELADTKTRKFSPDERIKQVKELLKSNINTTFDRIKEAFSIDFSVTVEDQEKTLKVSFPNTHENVISPTFLVYISSCKKHGIPVTRYTSQNYITFQVDQKTEFPHLSYTKFELLFDDVFNLISGTLVSQTGGKIETDTGKKLVFKRTHSVFDHTLTVQNETVQHHEMGS